MKEQNSIQILYFLVIIINNQSQYLLIANFMSQMQQVKKFAKSVEMEDEDDLMLIVRAYKSKDYSLVQDFISPKKWKKFMESMNKKSKIYFRFEPGAMDESNEGEETIEAVIVGPCGCGKTCLINHICGSHLPQGSGRSSLTRDVTQLPSQYFYEPHFIVYDTPGTTSIQEKLPHAVLLKSILTWKPLNTVFVMVKYHNRFDELIQSIFNQVYLLKGYEHSIVFLVSFFDLEDKPEQTIELINKILEQNSITNNIVYFSNKNCDEKDERALVDLLYRISASMPKTEILIEEDSFLRNFNLIVTRGEEVFFKQDVKNAFSMMEEVTDIYGEFAVSLPNNSQKQAILQDLEIYLKMELLDILEKFKEKFKTTIVTCDFYTSYYNLQKKIMDCMTELQRKIRSFQTYKLIQSSAYNTGYSDVTDIRDLIKRCPNPKCGLIWFRVQSCPNSICGSRPTCFFDFTKHANFNFTITRNGKKISFQKVVRTNTLKINKDEQLKVKQNHLKKIQERVPQKTEINFKPRGCGQSMNFVTLPRLPNIEEILMDWYNVDSMEEVISRFQQEKDLEKMRLQMERKARESFLSFRY